MSEKLEALRKLAHEAPMNTLRTDHDGHKWIGTYSVVWADRSREYAAALVAAKVQLNEAATP